MSSARLFRQAACFAVLLLAPLQGATLRSPDGRIAVTVDVKENLEPYPSGTRLYYSVAFDGKPLLLDSGFRLDFKGAPTLARDLRITGETRRSLDETWQPVWGIRKQMRDRANEITLSLAETSGPKRQFRFVVRAYDDGVAFRYELPDWGEFKLAAERSEFRFSGNPTVWAANYGGYVSHQEGEFKKMLLNDIHPGDVIGCPLLVQAPPAWVALTEADLSDWAGMYFTALPAAGSVMTTLSPRPDEPDVAVVSRAPRHSPWRVLMIGDRPGALVESNLIWNLNPPNALADASWVKPGVSSWDRWWCGSYAPDFPGKLGMGTASMKYFVDFAAEMGWHYQLTDWTWYGEPFDPRAPVMGMAGHPQADLGRSIPELDIPELVRYGASKGVKIWLWLEWDNANKQMERVFPIYEKWGIAGVKVDFMQRDDQWMVNFYERLVKLAAKHHLMVDFHGAYKPTGMERTWPNLLTREGVLGNEYNKWSTRVTPTHTVTLPFTRMLCGPMDFTPGGFRNKTVKDFRTMGDDPGPFVMGTRAHQLAMGVVYFSPLQVMADSPYAYRMSPGGMDFLRNLPAAWDETWVIDGFPGEFIVMARRSGDDWYVGAMTGDAARKITIPLSFLEGGSYEAQAWADAEEVGDYPDRVWASRTRVTSADSLTASLASAGGYVVRLVKQR